MSDNPLVFIIILTWNSGEDTSGCIESLKGMDYKNYKIVVVDNDSRDGSVAALRRSCPDLKVIQNNTNLGYGAGNRVGVDYAIISGAELIWILNPDVVVDSHCLTNLLRAYKKWGNAVYGCLAYRDKAKSRIAFGGSEWTGKFLTKNIKFYHSGLKNRSERRVMDEQVVPVVNGMGMLIPIDIIKKHGFMDESFFTYAEEHDYCLRIGKEGVQSVFVPSAIVFHKGEGSARDTPELARIRKYYRCRNKLVLYRRHLGLFIYLYQLPILFLAGIKEWLISLFKGKKDPPKLVIMNALKDSLFGRMGQTIEVDYHPNNNPSEK